MKDENNRMSRIREMYRTQWENLVITKINQGYTKSDVEVYADECIAMHSEEIAHKYS